MVAAGIAAVCGARLPGTPETDDSACARAGILNITRRHVDHIVPPANARDPLFWDEANWQVLCAECHSRKTATQDGGLGNPERQRVTRRAWGYTVADSFADRAPETASEVRTRAVSE